MSTVSKILKMFGKTFNLVKEVRRVKHYHICACGNHVFHVDDYSKKNWGSKNIHSCRLNRKYPDCMWTKYEGEIMACNEIEGRRFLHEKTYPAYSRLYRNVIDGNTLDDKYSFSVGIKPRKRHFRNRG